MYASIYVCLVVSLSGADLALMLLNDWASLKSWSLDHGPKTRILVSWRAGQTILLDALTRATQSATFSRAFGGSFRGCFFCVFAPENKQLKCSEW